MIANLQQLQGQYDNVTQRMAEAETTQRLAERQQSERFTLLDRALSPDYASGGGKKKIAIAGAVASLLGAIASGVPARSRQTGGAHRSTDAAPA